MITVARDYYIAIIKDDFIALRFNRPRMMMTVWPAEVLAFTKRDVDYSVECVENNTAWSSMNHEARQITPTPECKLSHSYD